jgi:hypothetical protein
LVDTLAALLHTDYLDEQTDPAEGIQATTGGNSAKVHPFCHLGHCSFLILILLSSYFPKAQMTRDKAAAKLVCTHLKTLSKKYPGWREMLEKLTPHDTQDAKLLALIQDGLGLVAPKWTVANDVLRIGCRLFIGSKVRFDALERSCFPFELE